MKVPVPVKPSRMCTPSSVRPWPKSLAQHLVGRVEDEVDDLDRGVDDAELVDGLLERRREELVVELDDDPLPALGVVDALDARRARSRRTSRASAFSASSACSSRTASMRSIVCATGLLAAKS